VTLNTPEPSASGHATLSDQDRTWGMIAHLSAFALFVLPIIGCVAGPLVVWLIKREHSAFVADAAKEAIRFNLIILVGYAICLPLAVAFVGIILWATLFVFWAVATIIAGIKAGEGLPYRYSSLLRPVVKLLGH
jgi:uncharacterized Tic20 family protein